jgi:diadenosine tetraphosphatase ApaH/serine/threonine PP2A family protein phosphatase
VLAGNHDWAVAGRTSTEYFNTMAREAVKWTRRVLTPENLEYLKELPLVHRFGEAFLAVHAAPCSPEDWEYILGTEDAVAQFRCFSQRACLVGHSHQPFAAEISPEGRVELGSLSRRELVPERRYIFNVGSVGQPRDADPRAAAAILDDGGEKGAVTLALERVPYDVTRAQEKILAAGLPAPLASRLGVGY